MNPSEPPPVASDGFLQRIGDPLRRGRKEGGFFYEGTQRDDVLDQVVTQ